MPLARFFLKPTVFPASSFNLLPAQKGPPATLCRPHIVYIMLDEWGVFEWSGAGHHIFAPHIDRLAREGIVFTQMLAGGPVCAPTRSTLMSGLHTGRTTVRANNGTEALRADDVTIAEMLKDAGYATGGFGKWGLGESGTTGAAERQGFDEFFGYDHHVQAHTSYPNCLIHNGQKVPLKGNTGHPFQGETFSQYLIHDKAKEFISRHANEKPFSPISPTPFPTPTPVFPKTILPTKNIVAKEPTEMRRSITSEVKTSRRPTKPNDTQPSLSWQTDRSVKF